MFCPPFACNIILDPRAGNALAAPIGNWYINSYGDFNHCAVEDPLRHHHPTEQGWAVVSERTPKLQHLPRVPSQGPYSKRSKHLLSSYRVVLRVQYSIYIYICILYKLRCTIFLCANGMNANAKLKGHCCITTGVGAIKRSMMPAGNLQTQRKTDGSVKNCTRTARDAFRRFSDRK